MKVHTFIKDREMLYDNGIQDWTDNEINYNPDMWACVPVTDELPADFSTEKYTIKDGKLVKASDEVIAERTAAKQAAADAAQIAELKAYLTSTDWAVVKCAELAVPLAELYPQVAAKRTDARARINEIEAVN